MSGYKGKKTLSVKTGLDVVENTNVTSVTYTKDDEAKDVILRTNGGTLTVNALAASDSVIIPIQCEFYSLDGVNQLLHTILQIQKKINPALDIEGVLLTMLDGRTLLGLEVVEDVRKFFNEKVFSTIIPRLVKLVEAPSHGKPIIEYDPKSKGALAYLNLAKEVIDRNGNK